MSQRWLAVLIGLMLAACASRQPPQVVERSLSGPGPTTHTVVKGETLYSIALRYDADYRELAERNGLDANFTIHPGQKLRLRGTPVPRKPPEVPAKSVQKVNKSAVALPTPSIEKSSVAKKTASVSTNTLPSVGTTRATGSVIWSWPSGGPLLGRFGAPGLAGKGLDFAGRRGDSVQAAAAGTVVYAGSGLVGYGKLLILRHDDNYISAYAHNDRFLVKEGDSVKAGQIIAEMGASGTDREKLHFEIRERGKPVDPLRFLPARQAGSPLNN